MRSRATRSRFATASPQSRSSCMIFFSTFSLAWASGAAAEGEGEIAFCARLWHAHKAAMARTMIRNNFIICYLNNVYAILLAGLTRQSRATAGESQRCEHRELFHT